MKDLFLVGFNFYRWCQGPYSLRESGLAEMEWHLLVFSAYFT
jgi:hypothetical protein